MHSQPSEKKMTNGVKTQKTTASYARCLDSTLKKQTSSNVTSIAPRFRLIFDGCRFETHVEIHHNRWAYLDMVLCHQEDVLVFHACAFRWLGYYRSQTVSR